MKRYYRFTAVLLACFIASSALNAKEALTDVELHAIEGGLCSVCDGANPVGCPGPGTDCAARNETYCNGGSFIGCINGDDRTVCGIGLGTCTENDGAANCGDAITSTCVWEDYHPDVDGLCDRVDRVTGSCPERDCTGTAW